VMRKEPPGMIFLSVGVGVVSVAMVSSYVLRSFVSVLS
jgi:hypothetical protein